MEALAIIYMAIGAALIMTVKLSKVNILSIFSKWKNMIPKPKNRQNHEQQHI